MGNSRRASALAGGVHFHLSGHPRPFDDGNSRGKDVTGHHRGRLKLHPLPGVNGSAHLARDDRLLGMEVALDDGSLATSTCPPTRTVPRTLPSTRTMPSVSRSPITVMSLAMIEKGIWSVRRRLSSFPCSSRAAIAEDPHQRPSFTMVCGSSDRPRWRISKWRCGAVERPLLPLSPMTSPGATVA